MKQLRTLAVLQAVCLVPILLRFLFLPADFSAVGLWFFAIAVGVVSIPYALWQIIRHPQRRAWASSMILLPVLAVGAPLILEPTPTRSFTTPWVGAAFVFLLLGSMWLLARPGLWNSERFWVGARFNSLLLVVLLIWMVLLAAPLILGLFLGFAPPIGDARQGLSLDALLVHAVGVGSTGALLAVFALLFSLVGLWRNRSRALIHGAQLFVVLVLLALLAVEAALLSVMLVNPG